jgi:cytochrome c-type biogenesis protein CcmH/NrfF
VRRSHRALALAPLLLLALLAIALPAASGTTTTAAAAPQPKVAISDIEDEVMCPVCGTLLELADSPQARREKAFVAGLIAAGESKDQIKDELVAQYGEEVLALPSDSGFDLSAYLVPLIAFVIAVIALAIGVARWRGRGREGPDGGAPAAPEGEEAERLDADIARYDL